MFFLYQILLLILSVNFQMFAASSSDDECVIAVASRPPTPVAGSRLRIIRGFSAVRLENILRNSSGPSGVAPNFYDTVQSQITNQLDQVPASTPRTDRSKHAVFEQISKELERQKKIVPGSFSSSDEENSSESSEHLSNQDLHHIILAQDRAAGLLTQMLVAQREATEVAEEREQSANFRANIEAVVAVVGTIFGIAGTAIAIVPLFIH